MITPEKGAPIAMPSDQPKGALKPITPARVAEELTKLCALRRNGEINAAEYDQRFARMIGELRDRRIDGSRAEIMAVLTPLREGGTVSEPDWKRLTQQLGLA